MYLCRAAKRGEKNNYPAEMVAEVARGVYPALGYIKADVDYRMSWTLQGHMVIKLIVGRI